MENKITEEKLKKYFSITEEALTMAKKAKKNNKHTEEVLSMAENYLSDAKHFKKQGNIVNAFAALNYAHGWLDAGAKIGIFDVNNSELFAGVDKNKEGV